MNHRKKVVDNRAQDGALVGNHNYNADTAIQDIEVSTIKEPPKWDKTKQSSFKWNHQIRLDVEDSISFVTGYGNFLKYFI